jgi:pimeloyl-ACP methyl ester carboxylesterase
MPHLELQGCNLRYTIDDHTDPWTKPETVLFVQGFTERAGVAAVGAALLARLSRSSHRPARLRRVGRVKRIRCPTLVVGTDTKHRGREVFESWQKTIPNSELVMLPVDGYHAAATDPDMTAKAVREFIDRHASR